MNGVVPKPLKASILYRVIHKSLDGAGLSSLPAVAFSQSEAPSLLNIDLFDAHRTALGENRLKTLVETFQASCNEIGAQLRHSIEKSDCYEVAEQAHRLAGDADALGAKAMAQTLRAIEAEASKNELRFAGSHHQQLQSLISQTLTMMQARLAGQ